MLEIEESKEYVTVALIIHGEPPKIKETERSLRDQTYKHIHIICLDDGTSPNAIKYLKSQRDLKIYDMPKHCNISHAKNFALKYSEDKFVFLLDDHIILGNNSVEEGMKIFSQFSYIIGVCGHYRSAALNDYNLLRDIKRETIYDKNDKERFITLDNFTTFSTGIAIIKKDAFLNLVFPEELFPTNFGGEDVPALITTLNQGKIFYYTPKMRGVHEHNLNLMDFIKKMEVEIRGRFSLLYWASNNPGIKIPYLYGFLSFPYFFIISLITCIPLSFINKYVFFIPLSAVLTEIFLSLKTFSSSVNVPWIYKLKASIFILSSDLLSVICFIQYLFSSYKRPYKTLGIKRFVIINRIFFRWELKKYGIIK